MEASAIRIMEDKDLERRVAEIIINELKLEDVTAENFNPELHLIEELGIDSMDLTTVVLVLQDEFGITINEEDYPKLSNVRLIAAYIKARMND